ncbi:MAG: hypothetical protein FWH29_04890 [Methanobrevibacter sp.]|nr:hypothetical protein [Methanobrevibacter sp.]
MTIRLNEYNIVDYLHSFNKKHIRQTKHSNRKLKTRKFSFELIIKLITEETPLDIKKEESKKFALVYKYKEQYNLRIIVAIKDKYINIVTQHLY